MGAVYQKIVKNMFFRLRSSWEVAQPASEAYQELLACIKPLFAVVDGFTVQILVIVATENK